MKRIAVFASIAATALLLSGPAMTEKSSDTYRQLDLFGAVFERVRSSYVDKVTDQKLIESAISGMLQSLDPHSSYMNAEEFKEMQVQTRGEFGGLGMEVTLDKGVVKVVSPIDDTPASKAGVQAGDYITHIDGKSVLGWTLKEAVEKLRGPVDTKVTIKIKRGDKDPFDVTLSRAVIVIKSVRSRIEGNVGIIRITSFTEQTDVGVREALASFKQKLGDKLVGVVLDLRNNPGGLLDQAIAVSDEFLEQGEIVSTRGRDGKVTSRFNAKKGDSAEGKPLIVLINGGSASASEIVAGALQDHRRGIIMGTQSFGKGSVQTIIPLGNQGAMRLTTARYYTPSGRSIQAVGVTPDIHVEQGKFEAAANTEPSRRERDLKGALENPDGKKTEDKKPDDTKKDDTAKKDDKAPARPADYQMERAIDMLKAISLYEARKAQR
ncbi:MAG: S41 family peptidase [Rhodospirillaceae bacterium]|nr:S41 family peptidase [Rhodospirillaceae bacterium]